MSSEIYIDTDTIKEGLDSLHDLLKDALVAADPFGRLPVMPIGAGVANLNETMKRIEVVQERQADALERIAEALEARTQEEG